MEKSKIQELFIEYCKNNNSEANKKLWDGKSNQFHTFWNEKILNDDSHDLNEAEIDQIVRILDRNGKGNTGDVEAVAKAMIPQGAWRRLFNEIKRDKDLRKVINDIFNSTNDQAELIDRLYQLNEGRKNNLTGKSGNAINAMLVAFNPRKYTSVISLKARKKIIDYFQLEGSPDFENDSPGEKIVLSNEAIIRGFSFLNAEPRMISKFVYRTLKSFWDDDSQEPSVVEPDTSEVTEPIESVSLDKSTFYMEKELENFLIKNWDKTELGKDFDLINEDGELVSQQYQTKHGIIDILVQDKKTKQYVVIELKRNQTSDDTVGQILRYLGWIEENKPNKLPPKGIIIASNFDEKLRLALKKVKDVEVYSYQIDFKLKEFKQ